MKTTVKMSFIAIALLSIVSCKQKLAESQSVTTSTEVNAPAEEKILNVYSWDNYMDPAVLEAFTKETGIKVVYDTFDSSETLEAHLLAGNSGYDIVVPGNPFLGRQIEAGVFFKLDKSKLSNWSNLDPVMTKLLATYDAGNAHAVPFMWGTTGLGMDVNKVRAILGPNVELNNWDVLFNPENAKKLSSCGISMLDTAGEVEGIALHYLGKDPGTINESDYDAAYELLKSIRPYIKHFSNTDLATTLASGESCLVLGWNGDMLQARRTAIEANNGMDIQYFIPSQGTEVWMDNYAIPADAPHKDNAHQFMNFIMRPEMIAKISNFVNYANPNKAANDLVSKELTGNPNVYPNDELRAKLYGVPVLPANIDRKITRVWTKLKSNQ
ncbi:MAG: polyamine ABC transporter substrate-binding protein [Arenimonas sp.]|nr:polyamine ABC transporter substrate-binding protein [Arenimonas sp.]